MGIHVPVDGGLPSKRVNDVESVSVSCGHYVIKIVETELLCFNLLCTRAIVINID